MPLASLADPQASSNQGRERGKKCEGEEGARGMPLACLANPPVSSSQGRERGDEGRERRGRVWECKTPLACLENPVASFSQGKENERERGGRERERE